MKRFMGLVVTILGSAATLWGGFHVIKGESTTQITIVQSLSINALTGGLMGVILISMGLLWIRD